jgi:hypothetical protein
LRSRRAEAVIEKVAEPGRHPDRDPSPARKGHRVPGPGPPDRGRGAAVRRRAKGAPQGMEGFDRRPRDVGDADPPLAPPLAFGPAGPVDHRDAAAGPARDRDAGRAARSEGHPQRRSSELARAEQVFFDAQPRRVDRAHHRSWRS